MNKLLATIVNLIFAVLLVASLSCAAEKKEAPKDRGREMINLKMGTMVLPFNHWKHQSDLSNDCFNCHKTKIGVIDGWSKDVAHKVCIPCHDLENKGPVQCHECHRK